MFHPAKKRFSQGETFFSLGGITAYQGDHEWGRARKCFIEFFISDVSFRTLVLCEGEGK